MIRVFTTGEAPLMDIIELQGRLAIPDDVKNDWRREDRSSSTTAAAAAAAMASPAGASPLPADGGATGETEKGEKEKEEGKGAAPIPLGVITQDHLNPKRCTLKISTLHVDGSRGRYKMPLLVLKKCTPQRVSALAALKAKNTEGVEERDDVGKGEQLPSTRVGGEEGAVRRAKRPRDDAATMLLSDWLAIHPEAFCVDTLFFPSYAATSPPLPPTASSAQGDAAKEGGSNATDDPSEKREAAEEAIAATTAPKPAITDYELVGIIEDHVCFNSKPARVFE